MRIYIASFFDTRARLAPHVAALKAQGHSITASWLEEEPNAAYNSASESYKTACALGDLTEIRGSDLMVLDTGDLTPRGGREVEYGLALAWGVPIAVVGECRNVFHRLARWRFAAWEEFLVFSGELQR